MIAATVPPSGPSQRAVSHVIVADLEALDLSDEDRHHLGTVLRLRPGELVTATDGRGGWRPCRYQPGGSLSADGQIGFQARPAPSVGVGFAPVKGDRPEWAVQKLAELGVDRIMILQADRSVVRWEGRRADQHLDRLRAIIRHAVMQSRQCWLPELTGVHPVSALATGSSVAVACRGGAAPSLSHTTILVGPEGGWTPMEDASARAKVELGVPVLRTESAAVAAGVLLTALRAGLVHSA